MEKIRTTWKGLPLELEAPMILIVELLSACSDDLWKLDGGNRQVTGRQGTAGLFTTFPAPYMSTWGSLLDQVLTFIQIEAVFFTFIFYPLRGVQQFFENSKIN